MEHGSGIIMLWRCFYATVSAMFVKIEDEINQVGISIDWVSKIRLSDLSYIPFFLIPTLFNSCCIEINDETEQQPLKTSYLIARKMTLAWKWKSAADGTFWSYKRKRHGLSLRMTSELTQIWHLWGRAESESFMRRSSNKQMFKLKQQCSKVTKLRPQTQTGFKISCWLKVLWRFCRKSPIETYPQRPEWKDCEHDSTEKRIKVDKIQRGEISSMYNIYTFLFCIWWYFVLLLFFIYLFWKDS